MIRLRLGRGQTTALGERFRLLSLAKPPATGLRSAEHPKACAEITELTPCKVLGEHSSDPARPIGRSTEMNRGRPSELERKLAQARRLALEPTDPLTRERLAQLIEDLEFQLLSHRQVA